MVSSGLLAGAIVLSALVVLLLAFSFIFQRWLQTRHESGPVDLTDEHGNLDPLKQIKHLKKSTAEFGIKYDELKFGKMLGKGSQGEVFKATWRGSTVAVKRVDTRKVPPEIIDEFTQEAAIMRRLRHPCLTLFMGVSLEHPHLCIVTEVVARGSLFDIIHDEHAALTWNKCLGIALDVARGMTYLHSFKPPILHRDLKSLNILVDENWRGKVADFGMTRFQEDGTMTQCGSPLWMAPEMIKNDPYGEAADVFSFAICLWEMYTRKIPYRDLGLNPSHLVVKVVKEHLRPPIPKQCPKAFKNLMEKCWNPVAEKRPTFAQILKVMEGFMQDPAILNHKPMSSRDSTVIVRPERTDDGGDTAITGMVGGALGAMGAALGLASGEKQWKIDSKEVAFYNESAATYADLAAAGAFPEPLTTPGGKGVRSRSTQNLSLLINPDTIASKAAPASSTGTTAPGTPDADASQGDTTVGTGELKRASSKNEKRSSKEKASKPATPSGSQPPSPSGSKAKSPASTGPAAPVEGIPAPLVLNTAIVATKDAKSARGGGGGEEAQPLGLQLASQGRGLLLGRFRNKVVTVKPCYLSRSHLVLSNEERVAADLDGGMKDTKVGLMMKRISALRHPNITLFMGAFVDGVDNLKAKLKESGLPELGREDAMQKDITNLSAVVSPSASSAASSSSSSNVHVGSSAAFNVGLPSPPPGCDYYLGYVQEHMLRGTLHDIFCDSHLVLDWDTMLQLLIDAAAGLTYLHGSGPIIHQDLTSHRLLVDKSYRVKVSEYGFVDLRAQLTGTALPPSPWSSPEYIKQPNQVNLSCASNVYSFGMIMWQALVRRPLWDNKPLTQDLINRIVRQGDRPALPSSLAMQKDLKNLIEKCWMANPDARPTFAFILEELTRLKKLGPPKITLKLGVNAHKYRKAKTVFAYRSKDAVTIMKDWGTPVGKKNCIVIFSGEDDVYLCEEEVFKATYEKIEPGLAITDGPVGATGVSESKTATGVETAGKAGGRSNLLSPSDPGNENDHHEYRKTGTVLARLMEDAFSVKTNGGTEHGMAGDYLVQTDTDRDDADQWSIEAKTFLELYERVD